MSNALLLTVIGMAITGIILGMKVALSIIRSVPMFGGGYPAVMPANQPINATAEKSSSSLGFTFLLLVFFIGCVLWIVTNPAYNTTPKAAPDTQQPKQENNTPQPKTESVPAPTPYQVATTRKVNQAPIEAPVTKQFGIQLAALTDYDRALELTEKLAIHPTIILEEAGLYKVIIASFTTENLAKTYQDDHPVLAEGFVREFIIRA